MMKLGFRLVFASCLGLSQLFSLTLLFRPLPAVAEPLTEPQQIAQSAASQRLAEMFSPEIQATVNACFDQGRADLAAGANPDGSLKCGDGSLSPDVSYTSYLETVSSILTASVLVGIKAAIVSDPRVDSTALINFLSDPQGRDFLRSGIESAITQNQLLPATATASVSLLTDAVMERLITTLQDPSSIDNLLGTSDQYSQVVENFCTAPGMTVSEAQTLTPLDPIQLYAICIQDSGITDEVLRTVQ